MQQATIQRAYSYYGFDDTRLLKVQKGYRNTSYVGQTSTGEVLNLIVYKDETGMYDRIQRIHTISNYLANYGMPVRKSYDTRVLRLKAVDVTRFAALYNYLPGETIPWEAYTKHHIKLLGMVMGRMHSALASMPQMMQSPLAAEEYLDLCDHMAAYFESSNIQRAIGEKLELVIENRTFRYFKDVLEKTKQLPHQQMLHLDLVRGNVLFDEVAENKDMMFQINQLVVSGILDFEKTAYGHPVFDIARTLAFLLVDSKYKSEEKVRKYFLASGYVKRGGAKISNIVFYRNTQKVDMLETLVTFFLLHDLYKFMKHNPYESLADNEHFIRTRDMLLRQNVIANI